MPLAYASCSMFRLSKSCALAAVNPIGTQHCICSIAAGSRSNASPCLECPGHQRGGSKGLRMTLLATACRTRKAQRPRGLATERAAFGCTDLFAAARVRLRPPVLLPHRVSPQSRCGRHGIDRYVSASAAAADHSAAFGPAAGRSCRAAGGGCRRAERRQGALAAAAKLRRPSPTLGPQPLLRPLRLFSCRRGCLHLLVLLRPLLQGGHGRHRQLQQCEPNIS